MPRAGHPAGENRPPPRSAQRPVDVSRTRWQARHRHQPHGSLPSLRGRTILVVDDDPDALELLHLILESCGAKVLAASTPMHARGYLQTVTPDLIVCDLLMPREDGLTPLRGVQASRVAAVARVPAIAVTAFCEDCLRRRRRSSRPTSRSQSTSTR